VQTDEIKVCYFQLHANKGIEMWKQEVVYIKEKRER
jgi:hypothetical protein